MRHTDTRNETAHGHDEVLRRHEADTWAEWKAHLLACMDCTESWYRSKSAAQQCLGGRATLEEWMIAAKRKRTGGNQ